MSEYACALGGILHALSGTAKLRLELPAIEGPPKSPFGFRVSTIRHGVTGTNESPDVGEELPACDTVNVEPPIVIVPVRL